MMNAIHCLRLNNQQRNLIGSIMHNARVNNLLFDSRFFYPQYFFLILFDPKKICYFDC